MRSFVGKYINVCLKCQLYKHRSGKIQINYIPIKKILLPFHTLHLVHVGPFVISRRGKRYILVLVDAFTKLLLIEPVKTTSTRHVRKTLLQLMYLFGAPSGIISDRGTAFTSHIFNVFCDTYGFKHTINAVARCSIYRTS